MSITLTTASAIPLNTVPTVRATLTQITADASYTTGGYAVSAAQLGLSSITSVPLCTVQTAAAGAVTAASYNTATGKLQLWTASAELANAVDVHLTVVNVLAFGV